MKKFLYLIFILLGLASCKKEKPIYPTDELPANVPSLAAFTGISMWGEFIIIDAVMYYEDHETGDKFVFNHFDIDKDTSSLRLGPPLFDIETIIRNKTSYSFYKPINNSYYGNFILNNDTTKHYEIYYMGMYMSIIEDPFEPQGLLGGSARPFSGQTISEADSTVAIQIQEMEGSLNGHNCHYWTQLKLKKIHAW